MLSSSFPFFLCWTSPKWDCGTIRTVPLAGMSSGSRQINICNSVVHTYCFELGKHSLWKSFILASPQSPHGKVSGSLSPYFRFKAGPPVPDGPQGQMFTRTRGSENGQRVYSVWLAFLWKAGGRKKGVRMRAWEGVLAGRPYACALTTVSMTPPPPPYWGYFSHLWS